MTLMPHELQVHHIRRSDRFRQSQPMQVRHAFKQALPRSEQHRHVVQHHLIDQPGLQLLIPDIGAARQ